MVSTVRMNKIKSYDLGNLTVVVEPGVLLNDLAEDPSETGSYVIPPDPGEKFATLGGNVSTNAGGMRAVKYGSTRDYVRAMQVVLPDRRNRKIRFKRNKDKFRLPPHQPHLWFRRYTWIYHRAYTFTYPYASGIRKLNRAFRRS